MSTAAALPRPPSGRVALNLLLRLSIAYFLAEVLLRPNDPRFAGKALPVRNLVVVGGLSLLFPALFLLGRRGRGPGSRWASYPWGLDSLYLSIFWLDMAGNSFDLYDRYFFFDLLPHTHGSGALAAVVTRTFGLTAWGGIGVTTVVHTLLEAQEYYTDVLAGTHNVRGTWDVVNDLLAGLVGAGVYATLARRLGGR